MQHPTSYKQAVRQLEGSRQQVADLQDQVVKLVAEIDALNALLKDYHEFNKYDAPQLRANYRAWDAERNALQERAQSLLAKAKES